MLRYLNMFVLIGLALVGISIVGFATHSRFLMEPGQPVNPLASWIYLGAGVMMLVNGFVSIQTAAQHLPETKKNETDNAGARERVETTAR